MCIRDRFTDILKGEYFFVVVIVAPCLLYTSNVPAEIGGYEVVWFSDYASSVKKNLKTGEEVEITLPKSDVLAYDLTDNLGVIVRPSGTEPKIKVYYTAVGSTWEEAEEKQAKMAADMNKMMGF